MDELLEELLDMLDYGDDTDFADTKFAVIAKIKQWQHLGQAPATCGHDWRDAYREVPDVRGQEPRPHSIPAVFYQRCTICNDVRLDPKELTNAEVAAAREDRMRDIPGQLSIFDAFNQVVAEKGWVENDV